MIAEVISIGDELTSGQRLDTNSQWLSQRLGELGIRVLFHTTVGDDLEANIRVFRNAIDRSDLVIATGGLGPTADDLTREALAAAAGRGLYRDESAVAHIRAIFSRRKREMPERNLVQAFLPVGSQLVPNPNGTAPGIALNVDRAGNSPARVFALPGVPAEMREMWEGTVAPKLITLLGDQRRFLQYHTINCFGVGESDLEAMLPDIIRRGRQPTVGITVSKATISLRIVAEGSTPTECDEQISGTASIIRECLGDLIFGDGEQELQHSVIGLCGARNRTLAVGEAGADGLLTSWLGEADPQRKIFLGSFVPRSQAHTTPERTMELAVEVADLFRTQIGLALSDFPEQPQAAGVPGEVHVAVAGPSGTTVTSFPYTGHPEILRPRAAKQALNYLRLLLLKSQWGS